MNSRHQAFVALIIANIIWGVVPPLFKWSLHSIPPLSLAFFRFLVATIVIFPFAYKHLRVEKKDIFDFVLIGIFGATLNIGLFILSLQYTASINAPLIGSSGPLFIMLISFFAFHVKPRLKTVLGTGIGLIGVLFIIFQPTQGYTFNTSLTGNMLLVVSGICGIIHLFVSKKIAARYSPLTITFYSFSLPIITFFPFFLSDTHTHGLSYLANPQALIGILYGAIFASLLAHLLYYASMKMLQTNDIAIFAYVPPLVTILVAIPLLGEVLSVTYLIGAILVFTGLYIAEAHIHHHPFHHRR